MLHDSTLSEQCLVDETMYLRGYDALQRFLALPWKECLDIGSGEGRHAAYVRERGRTVRTVDLRNADVEGDYLDVELKTDAIWCCHTLEHHTNPGLFLKKCFDDLNDGGFIAVTVPPAKHFIVGGHVTLWNAGLLCYQMILAGFDLRNASVGSYGYNISVIAKKEPFDRPELRYDNGDINTLGCYFPIPVRENFDGRLPNIRW